MYNEHDPLLALIRIWTYYDPLRKEPGFKAILQNMNLKTYDS
jgi:hypothetical protein